MNKAVESTEPVESVGAAELAKSSESENETAIEVPAAEDPVAEVPPNKVPAVKTPKATPETLEVTRACQHFNQGP